MKKALLTSVILLLFVPLFSQAGDSLFISLKPAEFSEEITIVSNPVIIDVREFFEYKRSRLNGAINIPASGSIDTTADTTGRATHLFLYCTSGFRSDRVARKLAAKGFIHVYSLDGGINEWKKQGFPVDKKRLKRRMVEEQND